MKLKDFNFLQFFSLQLAFLEWEEEAEAVFFLPFAIYIINDKIVMENW